MRGKRFISAVLLGAIFCAQFLFVSTIGTEKVQAETLPGSVSQLVVTYDNSIKNLSRPYPTLYEYYKANIEGKNPPQFPTYDKKNDIPGIFMAVYDQVYSEVSQVNEDWIKHILSSTMNDNVFKAGIDPAQVNSRLEYERRYIVENIIPFVGYVYYGLKILAAMDADSTFKAAVIAAQGQGDYDEKIRDLDVKNSKRLIKPGDLAESLRNGTFKDDDWLPGSFNPNGDNDPRIYKSLDGSGMWYPDFVVFANLILESGPITDQVSLDAYKTKVLAAATSMDQSGSGVSEVTATESKCGKSGYFDPGTAIKIAFCEIILSIRDLFTYLLKSSMQLVVIASGIDNGDKLSDKPLLFDGLQGSIFAGNVGDTLIDSNKGAVARSAYQRVLNFANGGVLLMLIIIALANVLQIQINVYSFKKLLPGLILGLLLANASFLIVRAMLETSEYVASGLITKEEVKGMAAKNGVGPKYMLDQFAGMGTVGGSVNTNFADAKGVPDSSLVFQQAILNLFIFVAAVLLLILGLLFVVRTIIFLLLLPLAPLAFIGLYFPPLSKVWSRWWALVINWTFMPVIAFFWLWLGFTWMASVPTQGTGVFAYSLNYIFGIAMIWAAVKTPFSLAGEAKGIYGKLESKLNAAPGKLWGATGGAQLKKTGEALNARAQTFTPVGDYNRWRERREEDRKDRNDTYKKGYAPKAITELTEKRKAFELNKQRLENDVRDLEIKRQKSLDNGKHDEADTYTHEIQAIQAKLTADQKAIENGDGMGRGVRKMVSIMETEKVREQKKASKDAGKKLADMTAEELLSHAGGRRGDEYRKLTDAIKDSQLATKEIGELVKRHNENAYAEGRPGIKDSDDAKLLKQWRLESNMRSEGVKKSLEKDAEDRMRQTQLLTLLRGKPKDTDRPGEDADSLQIRQQMYKSAQKAARDFVRDEQGKRALNIIAVHDSGDKDVIAQFNQLVSRQAVDNSLAPEVLKDVVDARGKAIAEFTKRMAETMQQANTNKDRIDHTLIEAHLKSFQKSLDGVVGAEKDLEKVNEILGTLSDRTDDGLENTKKQLKELVTMKDGHLRELNAELAKDTPNGYSIGPVTPPGGTP